MRVSVCTTWVHKVLPAIAKALNKFPASTFAAKLWSPWCLVTFMYDNTSLDSPCWRTYGKITEKELLLNLHPIRGILWIVGVEKEQLRISLPFLPNPYPLDYCCLKFFCDLKCISQSRDYNWTNLKWNKWE